MSLRRKGRELALQILYQWDIHRDTSGWLEDFWAQNPTHSEAKTFAEGLVDGVITHSAELDILLGRYAEHWTVHRMAITDRTVLRMAVYELLYLPDIPARVTLNEAIEIVKVFGDEQSGSFVNGILDRILREEPRLQSKAQEAVTSAAHD
jgi:transcription antitermination protein NusB